MVAQKIWHKFFLHALTLPNINQFSKLLHCQNREKFCNNTVAKDPTTPQVCCYTTRCFLLLFLNMRYYRSRLVLIVAFNTLTFHTVV